MTASRTQDGTVIVVAMVALVALISIGGLASLAVRGGLSSGGQDRFKSMALQAAESGAAVAMDFLRARIHADDGWSDFVLPSSDVDGDGSLDLVPYFTTDITGNGKQPGEVGNLFSPELKMWYRVEILNNRDDTVAALIAGDDSDDRVVIRSTGYGPNGSSAQIEVEVRPNGVIGGFVPGDPYGQKGMGATNSNTNTDDRIDDSSTGAVNIN